MTAVSKYIQTVYSFVVDKAGEWGAVFAEGVNVNIDPYGCSSFCNLLVC